MAVMMGYEEGMDFCEELRVTVMARATNPDTVDTYELCMMGGEFHSAVTAAVGAIEEDHLALTSDLRGKFIKFLSGHEGMTTDEDSAMLIAAVEAAPAA